MDVRCGFWFPGFALKGPKSWKLKSELEMITFLPSEYIRAFPHGGGPIATAVCFVWTTDLH